MPSAQVPQDSCMSYSQAGQIGYGWPQQYGLVPHGISGGNELLGLHETHQKTNQFLNAVEHAISWEDMRQQLQIEHALG